MDCGAKSGTGARFVMSKYALVQSLRCLRWHWGTVYGA